MRRLFTSAVQAVRLLYRQPPLRPLCPLRQPLRLFRTSAVSCEKAKRKTKAKVKNQAQEDVVNMEDVTIDDSVPVTPGERRQRKVYSGVRSEIVSRGLCGKALDRLSLSEYAGCVLIDMNPGLGIWSRALHDRIKPRRHILLEPTASYHDELRKLRSDRPNVSLLHMDGYAWETYTQLFAPPPHPSPPFPPDFVPLDVKTVPVENGINKDLLFSGNISNRYQTDLLVTQFVQCIGTRGWLQEFGRVRFLLWMDDATRERLLPEVLSARTKPAVIGEALCEIREICSTGKRNSGQGYHKDHTEHIDITGDILSPEAVAAKAAKIKSAKRVRKSKEPEPKAEVVPPAPETMQARGRHMSYYRGRPPPAESVRVAMVKVGRLREFANTFRNRVPKTPSEAKTNQKRVENWTAREARMIRKCLQQFLRIPSIYNPPFENTPIETLREYIESFLLEENNPLLPMLKEATKPTRDNTDRYQPTSEEAEAFAEFEEALLHRSRLSYQTFSVPDEMYAKALRPPLLQMWEKENREPIRCRLIDFKPTSRPMAFLDFRPRLINEYFRHPEDGRKNFRVFQWVIRSLFLTRVQKLKIGLRHLAPGAESILELIGEDGSEGSELGEKRIRILTVDELVKVCRAWDEWEFKPATNPEMMGVHERVRRMYEMPQHELMQARGFVQVIA